MTRRLSIGCLVAVLAPLLTLATCVLTDSHPDDSAMIEEFADERDAFETLRTMILSEPRVTHVTNAYLLIDGDTNVTQSERSAYLGPDRWDRYRALFDTLALEGGVLRRADGSVAFIRSSAGRIAGESDKGYLWTTHPPQSFLFRESDQSTEAACAPRSNCETFRQIEGNWYLMFERH